jgi:hypothetical protein
VYIPSPVVLIQLDKPAQIASLNRIFKALAQRALSAEDSLAYMEKLIFCRTGASALKATASER